MKRCEAETTVTIDMKKFPKKYRTGENNPIERLDERQLADVETWINSLVPGGDRAYCAEFVGRIPIPVAMLVGSILEDTGCQRLTCINPGYSVTVVWDYTEEAVDFRHMQECEC